MELLNGTLKEFGKSVGVSKTLSSKLILFACLDIPRWRPNSRLLDRWRRSLRLRRLPLRRRSNSSFRAAASVDPRSVPQSWSTQELNWDHPHSQSASVRKPQFRTLEHKPKQEEKHFGEPGPASTQIRPSHQLELRGYLKHEHEARDYELPGDSHSGNDLEDLRSLRLRQEHRHNQGPAHLQIQGHCPRRVHDRG